MASRFWVPGGDGNWGSTNNWSATSGGGSGASVPGASDDVIFDGNSGSGTCTLNASARSCLTFNSINSTNNTLAGSQNLTVAGACSFGALFNITATGLLTLSVAATHTFNGKTWPGNMTLTGTGTHTFNDAARCTGLLTFSTSIGATRTYAGAGSLRADGGVTFGNTASSVISLTLTGGLIIGGGTVTHGTNSRVSGLITVVASATITGSLQMAGTLLQTGGTLSWTSTPIVFVGGGDLTLSVTSPLTGVEIRVASGLQLALNGSQPWTATSKLTVNGTSGSPCTVKSSTGGVQASQTLPAGMIIDLNYCNLTDIAASSPLYTSRGTVSNCSNCQSLNPYTVPFSPLGSLPPTIFMR